MSDNPRSEMVKMIAGLYYDPSDPELSEKRCLARKINKLISEVKYNDWATKRRLYEDFFGSTGLNLTIEQPFTCDYGVNITWGNEVYVNFDCIFLDSAPIIIGDRVKIAPSVRLFTATHPLDHQQRNSGLEFAKSIIIGSDVWLCGGVIVNPGIRVGDRSVVGSGSIVTRDIPSDVLAAGNPARIIRKIV